MKKILFIISLPPPVHGASMMGQYIVDSRTINSHFDCDYINSSTSPDVKDIGRGLGKKVFSLLTLYWKIIKALLKKRYDLCYININASGPAYFKEVVVVFILKRFSCKIIYHCHNKGISLQSKKWLYDCLYSFQFKNTRVILLSSRLQFDINKYLATDKIFFCGNGIPDLNANYQRPSGIQNNIRLLFLSNMMIEKGVFTLLKACKTLKERNYSFECHFVGGWLNITESDFDSKVEELGLNSYVVAHGGCYGDDKKKHFLNADIFVLPTHNDCLPLVLIEAMQYFLPIVTTDDGAIPDIVEDHYNGFITNKQDPDLLADRIAILIDSESLRFEMGANGRKKYEQYFTLECFEKKFTSVLQLVASEKQ